MSRSRIGVPVAFWGVPLLAAFALLLGWLRTLYYYGAFGVDLGLVDLGVVDHLRESWFVMQNLAFFVVLWWAALKLRRPWVIVVAVPYSLLPIAAHYAFDLDGPFASGLITYRHTLLKLIPFAVLVLAWLLHRDRRASLLDPRWPGGRAAATLFVIVAASRGISAAKHFGSYDALRAMRDPEAHLSLARWQEKGDGQGLPGLSGPANWYLIYADRESAIVWRAPTTRAANGRSEVLVLPRERLASLSLRRRLQVQPGGAYL